MAIRDVFDDGVEFFLLRPVHHIREILSDIGPVRGRDQDVQIVDFRKLSGFRIGRAGHARQLLVHAEEVLEGDGGERLVFVGDLDAFLGFDRLVKAVRPPAPRHQPSRELIDDQYFPVLHHVVHVAVIQHMRSQSLDDMVNQRHVRGVV